VSLKITVAHDAHCIRLVLVGDPRLGHLRSLLQVLEVDSVAWRRPGLLLDLRGMRTRLPAADQALLVAEAAQCLRRMKRIAVLAPAWRTRDGGTVRVFDDEADALRWLACATG
jgi:hypothetical protein